MIKKIIFFSIILIITSILLFYVFLDKFFIKKTIADIEDNLNVKIILNENYKLNVFPKLYLISKFNLIHKDYNLFIENAEFSIYKNYNRKESNFTFNTEKIKIGKFFIEQLISTGQINEYRGNNFISKFEIYPKGYINYNLTSDEKSVLKFLSLIFKRLNLPTTYKKLFDFIFNIFEEDSYFTGKINFNKELLIIDYLKSNKNDFDIFLSGTYNLEFNILDIKINLNHFNEKLAELNITENINNPNIEIVTNDNLINYNFSIHEINKILEGDIESIIGSIILNE